VPWWRESWRDGIHSQLADAAALLWIFAIGFFCGGFRFAIFFLASRSLLLSWLDSNDHNPNLRRSIKPVCVEASGLQADEKRCQGTTYRINYLCNMTLRAEVSWIYKLDFAN